MEWYLNCSQITSSFLLGCQNKNRANAIIAHDVIKILHHEESIKADDEAIFTFSCFFIV